MTDAEIKSVKINSIIGIEVLRNSEVQSYKAIGRKK